MQKVEELEKGLYGILQQLDQFANDAGVSASAESIQASPPMFPLGGALPIDDDSGNHHITIPYKIGGSQDFESSNQVSKNIR